MRIGPAKACCLMALCLCAVVILISEFLEESPPASTEQNSRQNAHDADGCGHGCSGCSGHGSDPFRLGEVTDAASDRLYTKIPEDHQHTPLVEADGEVV